jgi:hypothetical protein
MLIQLAGALLILAGFIAAQTGHLNPRTPGYLALNLVGSAILTYDALHGQEWGFFVLEFVWALVSAFGLVQLARGRTAAVAH